MLWSSGLNEHTYKKLKKNRKENLGKPRQEEPYLYKNINCVRYPTNLAFKVRWENQEPTW